MRAAARSHVIAHVVEVMAKDQIYFDESSIPVFDDWLSSEFQEDTGESISHHQKNEGQPKSGLGHVETLKRKVNAEDRVLLKKIETKRRKACTPATADSLNEEMDIHGVLEKEDLVKSRFKLKVNARTRAKYLDGNHGETEDNTSVVRNFNSSVSPNPTKTNSADIKDRAENNNSAVKENKVTSEGPVKIRKPKKRSKQKNIRKDNRPIDQLPAYVLPGTGHLARPLTQVTRETYFIAIKIRTYIQSISYLVQNLIVTTSSQLSLHVFAYNRKPYIT